MKQNRFKSLISWAGIISTITLIIGVAGIDVETITSWNLLFDVIVKIISNPFILFSIIVQWIANFNNPTDKKKY